MSVYVSVDVKILLVTKLCKCKAWSKCSARFQSKRGVITVLRGFESVNGKSAVREDECFIVQR